MRGCLYFPTSKLVGHYFSYIYSTKQATKFLLSVGILVRLVGFAVGLPSDSQVATTLAATISFIFFLFSSIFMVRRRTILEPVSGLVGRSVGLSQHKFQNKEPHCRTIFLLAGLSYSFMTLCKNANQERHLQLCS